MPHLLPRLAYKSEKAQGKEERIGHPNGFYASSFFKSPANSTLNVVRTKGWIKNSWVKKANGKL